MAEQVNKRVEGMINELEQMQRIQLYTPDEIREISRKRKEYEYKIQRQTKQKEDYANYIAYEFALLEDISLRRKQTGLNEQKTNIEYAIVKSLNRIFKQFIYRFQNDLEVYFQYIKFCQSVGFAEAISGIIGQMLQMYGDKPKMWQMAAKWEHLEQNNLETARSYLLKGVHRHPEADMLYTDLFNIELAIAYKCEENEDKEKYLKRADVVWRNGMKNLNDVKFLFKIYELSLKYDIAEELTQALKAEIWSHKDTKEVWSFIASNELKGDEWNEIDDLVNQERKERNMPNIINRFMSVYEELLSKFPEEKLCTKYIHELLSLNDNICTGPQNITAVKQAWIFGHKHGLLSEFMYSFGVEMFKIENVMSTVEIFEILDAACKIKPNLVCLWKEKLLLNKGNDKNLMVIIQDATAAKLNPEEMLLLWNVLLDNVTSSDTITNIYKKFQSCENVIYLSLKPKLLKKVYDNSGLKATRDLYHEFIRTPPIQLEVHTTMIDIENSQPSRSYKNIKKCYEYMVQHLGTQNYEIWMKYVEFEKDNDNAKNVPIIYRRAVATLKKELADEFIKAQTLAKLK